MQAEKNDGFTPITQSAPHTRCLHDTRSGSGRSGGLHTKYCATPASRLVAAFWKSSNCHSRETCSKASAGHRCGKPPRLRGPHVPGAPFGAVSRRRGTWHALSRGASASTCADCLRRKPPTLRKNGALECMPHFVRGSAGWITRAIFSVCFSFKLRTKNGMKIMQ